MRKKASPPSKSMMHGGQGGLNGSSGMHSLHIYLHLVLWLFMALNN